MIRALLLAGIFGTGLTALCQPILAGSAESGIAATKTQTCESSASPSNPFPAFSASAQRAPGTSCNPPSQWQWNAQLFSQGNVFGASGVVSQVRPWNSPLTMNAFPASQTPADRQPRPRAVPIPTQWPKANVEQIPTRWPQLKIQPVDPHSGPTAALPTPVR